MCLDISFKIDSLVDSIYDYLPDLIIDPQICMDYSAHVQAHDRMKSDVIYLNAEGKPYLTSMRWGIVAKYMLKDPVSFWKYAQSMFNARSDKILDKKSFWYKIRQQRCLIRVPGIYEHRNIIGWKKKVPYYISLENKKSLLIPGFYYFLDVTEEDIKRIKATNDKKFLETVNKIVNLETGEITPTFAMCTQDANEKMRHIHNDGANKYRMPLFRQPEQAIKWLDPNLKDEGIKDFLSYEIPSEDIDAYAVDSIRYNPQRADGLEKDQPFEWSALPPLGNDTPLPPQKIMF